MAWVVQFKWERKKVEYEYYVRERERLKKKEEKRQQLNSPLSLKKKKSSKLAYLISFTYRFKISSLFFFFNSENSYKDKEQWERKKGQSKHI